MELATRDLYWLAKIPALANQRISVMQLTGSLGRFAHLCGARASAGNLVRVVATEQAAIGAFDHTRFAGGRDPQNSHRVLIGARTIGQRLALLHVIGSQSLQLLRRPAEPFAPQVDQVALGVIHLAVRPGHAPTGAQ